MIAAIGHRGPDGTGFHIEPGVALGHARLSIIDLGGGAQPIHNGDETVWISYNGEVFNYIELRKWLEERGHKFYTHTDTEVIVHLYDELGDEFVHELNGQFAFALWDRKRRRLLLVRDRAGILPLYYARVAGGVAFGSEVKTLLASGLVQPAMDPQGLDELMTFWAPMAPRTVFKGVSQVCPGEMVILEGANLSRRQYWDWDFPRRFAAPARIPGPARRRAAFDSHECHRNPPARRRARGRLSIGRPRFLDAGRVAEGTTARHARNVFDRLRRCGAR